MPARPAKKRAASAPIRLVISGCRGRMGALLVEEALKNPAFQLVGGTEPKGSPQVGRPIPGAEQLTVTDDLGPLMEQADMLIEFTAPEATLAHARAAAEAHVPMVIGTTGFSLDQMKRLEQAARKSPLFWSPNMSIGIVIVRRTISAISELLFNFGLGEVSRARISETHHTQKKDAPSGTAKALAEELMKTTGWLIPDEEIEAKREGEVVGIHSVTFEQPAERITVTHEATDRRVFAQGALLVAAHFSKIFKKPGLYRMDDFITALQKQPAPSAR